MTTSRTGLVIRSLSGFFDIDLENTVYRCRGRGILRKQGVVPLVGDWAKFTELASGEGILESILPRSNQLDRPPVANVGLVIVVLSATHPEPDLLLADKILVVAGHKKIPGLVCVNKSDLNPEAALNLAANYKLAGYPAYAISALTGQGLDELFSYLGQSTMVLAGQSGTGKSQLTEALTGQSIKTGVLSKKIDRGRHTTRQVQLLATLSGGKVADTPGFSSLDLDLIPSRGLHRLYPEYAQFKCRFSSCLHLDEPSCGVRDALEERLVPQFRYDNYLRLFQHLKEKEDYRY